MTRLSRGPLEKFSHPTDRAANVPMTCVIIGIGAPYAPRPAWYFVAKRTPGAGPMPYARGVAMACWACCSELHVGTRWTRQLAARRVASYWAYHVASEHAALAMSHVACLVASHWALHWASAAATCSPRARDLVGAIGRHTCVWVRRGPPAVSLQDQKGQSRDDVGGARVELGVRGSRGSPDRARQGAEGRGT